MIGAPSGRCSMSKRSDRSVGDNDRPALEKAGSLARLTVAPSSSPGQTLTSEISASSRWFKAENTSISPIPRANDSEETLARLILTAAARANLRTVVRSLVLYALRLVKSEDIACRLLYLNIFRSQSLDKFQTSHSLFTPDSKSAIWLCYWAAGLSDGGLFMRHISIRTSRQTSVPIDIVRTSG